MESSNGDLSEPLFGFILLGNVLEPMFVHGHRNVLFVIEVEPIISQCLIDRNGSGMDNARLLELEPPPDRVWGGSVISIDGPNALE